MELTILYGEGEPAEGDGHFYDPRRKRRGEAVSYSVKPAPPRLAVSLQDAAAALDVSEDFFREHIKPEIKIVRRGRRQFVAIRELERWLEESAAKTFE